MPELRQRPTGADIEFMRALEDDFKAQTGLKDRSQFKIFYCPVWQAPIMLLGINPAGDPGTIAPDGVHYRDGRNSKAASSSGYCENGESDLVDCTWPENTGLLKLLMPILGSTDVIRRSVVKTNLAFVRLQNIKDRRTIDCSKDQSAPFLRRILDRVQPDIILLTGVKLRDFGTRHCAEVLELSERQEDRSVNQTVIFPARVRLLGGHTCIAVEVAHASQFNWVYDKYNVALKIKVLLSEGVMSALAASDSSRLFASTNWQPKQEGRPMRDAPIGSVQVRTEANGGVQMDSITPEETKRILRELCHLGLDDDTYKKHIHHEGHSIDDMLKYSARTYIVGSRNRVLHKKLQWILCMCKKRGLPPGSTAEITKLAKKTAEEGWTSDSVG